MAPLGRLGLKGAHPPAPRAPSVTLCAAIGLRVAAPLPALLGHLGLEGTHSPSFEGTVSVRAGRPSAYKRPSGRPVADLPPHPEGVYTPIAQSIAMRGTMGGRDAPRCTGEHGASRPEVRQHCTLAGGQEDSLAFPCLICMPPPPPSSVQGLEGQAMEAIALAEDSASGSAERHGSSWNCSG